MVLRGEERGLISATKWVLAWNGTLDPFCVCLCVCVCACGVGVSYPNDLSFMCISLSSVLMKFLFPNIAQYVILLSEKGHTPTHTCTYTSVLIHIYIPYFLNLWPGHEIDHENY